MALTNENGGGMVMPVAPYGGGAGGFGGDWAWILLLLVLFGAGGFGGGFGGNDMYPWMNQADITTSGFQNQMLQSNLAGLDASVTNGFANLQTALCSGFANVTNGFSQAEIAANARQMADMNQMFALQSSLQNCCCENRASIADLKYTIASEACTNRQALNASTQKILDQMCADKIDAKNEKIADLERQLALANLAASQVAQTAQIEQYIASRSTTAA